MSNQGTSNPPRRGRPPTGKARTGSKRQRDLRSKVDEILGAASDAGVDPDLSSAPLTSLLESVRRSIGDPKRGISPTSWKLKYLLVELAERANQNSTGTIKLKVQVDIVSCDDN